MADAAQEFFALEDGLWLFSGPFKAWDFRETAEYIKSGQREDPSLLIMDGQSIKTPGKGEQRGFDGGEKGEGT